jgi:S-adenosylmethionine synthetase
VSYKLVGARSVWVRPPVCNIDTFGTGGGKVDDETFIAFSKAIGFDLRLRQLSRILICKTPSFRKGRFYQDMAKRMVTWDAYDLDLPWERLDSRTLKKERLATKEKKVF